MLLKQCMSYGPSSAHWLAKKPPGQWQQNEIYYVILSKLRIQGPKAYLHSLPHKSLLPIPTIIHVCSSGSWRGLKFIATPERGMTQWYVHKLDFTPLLLLRPTRFLQLGSNDPYGRTDSSQQPSKTARSSIQITFSFATPHRSSGVSLMG